MIFSFYGKAIPWQELLSETIDEQGICSAASLVRSATKHGFDAHGYKKDIANLRGMEMPCILHWNTNTFVVLEGFEGEKVFIIDPAIGRSEYSFDKLETSFSGVVLTFKP